MYRLHAMQNRYGAAQPVLCLCAFQMRNAMMAIHLQPMHACSHIHAGLCVQILLQIFVEMEVLMQERTVQPALRITEAAALDLYVLQASVLLKQPPNLAKAILVAGEVAAGRGG